MPKKGSGKKELMGAKELAFVDAFIEYATSKEPASKRTQEKKRGYAYTLIAVLHTFGKTLFTATYADFSRIPANLKNPAGEPIRQNTRQSYVSQLKAMVSYLEKTHKIDGERTLFSDIKAGSPSKQNKNVLSADEWQTVLNSPMSAKERAYIAMLYDGYHRPGEPLTLKWSDLRINESGAIQYKIVFKTEIPREIVQKPDCTALLEAWRRESGHNYGDDAYIFPANGGRQYTSRGFTADLFEKISKATGIALLPSSIRNTAISHDVQNEMPLQYVCLRAWGEPYNDMVNVYTKANSAKLQTDAQATANGRAAVKIEQAKPREIRTMKKCPACGKDNAIVGTFCVWCGANMSGESAGKFSALESENAGMRAELAEMRERQEKADAALQGVLSVLKKGLTLDEIIRG